MSKATTNITNNEPRAKTYSFMCAWYSRIILMLGRNADWFHLFCFFFFVCLFVWFVMVATFVIAMGEKLPAIVSIKNYT